MYMSEPLLYYEHALMQRNNHRHLTRNTINTAARKATLMVLSLASSRCSAQSQPYFRQDTTLFTHESISRIYQAYPHNTTKMSDATKKVAKKPAKKPEHPPVAAMVNAALTNLKERKGSSLAAIKKYVAATYKVDAVKLAPFIRRYLKKAVTDGKINQTKGSGASGSFKLVKKTEEKKPKKPAAAKKPAAKKAAKKPAAKKTPKKAKKAAPKKEKKAKKAATPKKPKAKKATKSPKKAAKKAAPKKK